MGLISGFLMPVGTHEMHHDKLNILDLVQTSFEGSKSQGQFVACSKK